MKKQSLKLLSIIFFTSLFFYFSDIFSDDKNIIRGKPKVIDGDTVKVNNKTIRFSGIDAPESNYRGKKQICYLSETRVFCGDLSKKKLIKKIGDHSISCEIEKEKDFYGRMLGECFLKAESLSKFLVREGYAFAFVKYSKKYVEDEKFAKVNNFGIWSMKFEYPWEWRKKINDL